MKRTAFGTSGICKTFHMRTWRLRVLPSVAVLLLTGIASVGFVGAGDLDRWVMTHPNYVGVSAIAASPDRILVVGDSGAVILSQEDEAWTNRNLEADVTVWMRPSATVSSSAWPVNKSARRLQELALTSFRGRSRLDPHPPTGAL